MINGSSYILVIKKKKCDTCIILGNMHKKTINLHLQLCLYLYMHFIYYMLFSKITQNIQMIP